MVRAVRYTLPDVALNPIAKIAISTAQASVMIRASLSITASETVVPMKLRMMSATVEFDMEFSADDSEPIAAPRIPATNSPEITTGRPCRMKFGYRLSELDK